MFFSDSSSEYYSFSPPVGTNGGTSFALSGNGRITAIRLWENTGSFIAGSVSSVLILLGVLSVLFLPSPELHIISIQSMLFCINLITLCLIYNYNIAVQMSEMPHVFKILARRRADMIIAFRNSESESSG